jgi:hypothetical protein
MRRRVLYILRQFGIDPVRFKTAFIKLPRYLVEAQKFRKANINRTHLSWIPSLNDYSDTAGTAKGHYFWQDLIAAQWVYENKPKKHLDVASRVDGFVAHIATFMTIEVLDIRELKNNIPNVIFKQANLQRPLFDYKEKYESVSCLHAVEHFGLGRYGDVLDPNGHVTGLINIANTVATGGSLFISYPVGNNLVEFNSQRLLSPDWALDVLPNFQLRKCVLIPWTEAPVYGQNPRKIDQNIFGQAVLMELIKE